MSSLYIPQSDSSRERGSLLKRAVNIQAFEIQIERATYWLRAQSQMSYKLHSNGDSAMLGYITTGKFLFQSLFFFPIHD